jgi:precorrin-6B methylase 2
MADSIDSQIQKLGGAVRTLAMIGAALKLRAKHDVEPEIREQIMRGAKAALGEDPDKLDEGQLPGLLAMIGMVFGEAGELFRHPERGGAWEIEDTTLLQAQGQGSRQAFRRIVALAESRPLLGKTLEGRFLDVGTGVGGIALEAASSCPELIVDGIDIWEPSLALARQNVAASPYAARVNVWRCDVAELEPLRRYSLVWLPTMFMKRAVVEQALNRILAASLGGAYLVVARYTRTSDPVAGAFATLRTLRSGGDLIEASELEDMLRARSYLDVETDVLPLATYTLGRLP